MNISDIIIEGKGGGSQESAEEDSKKWAAGENKSFINLVITWLVTTILETLKIYTI